MASPLILIQARTGGTRFPGKVLQEIQGRPMWKQVLHRVHPLALAHVAWAESFPHICEDDVLGRFARYTSKYFGPEWDPIIRLTADCPLIDPGVVAHVLGLYRMAEGDLDLVATGPEWDGLDVEVFSQEALRLAEQHCGSSADREHVTPWMRRNLRTRVVPLNTTLRWSVDDPEGLAFVRVVYAACVHCAEGVPHHTNAAGSISGQDRMPVFDLHHLSRGDLAECTAYPLLQTRMGGPVYVSGGG